MWMNLLRRALHFALFHVIVVHFNFNYDLLSYFNRDDTHSLDKITQKGVIIVTEKLPLNNSKLFMLYNIELQTNHAF